MYGPGILVRSLAKPSIPDKYGNVWQYHSRSDRHSKVACWGVLFDLLLTCPLLRNHVERGAVGFGINHEMHDFRTARRKDLDLVICTPGTIVGKRRKSFGDLVADYDMVLSKEEASALAALPPLIRVPVGSVHVALEAKATMTAHVRALPRLYDELNSSHLAIHGSSEFCIAVGLAIVNFAREFVSSDKNKFDMKKLPPVVSQHTQPGDAERTIQKIREIPRRTQTAGEGFDALGILGIDFRNDDGPLAHVTAAPAPAPNDLFHYDSMVRRIAHHYENRFANV